MYDRLDLVPEFCCVKINLIEKMTLHNRDRMSECAGVAPQGSMMTSGSAVGLTRPISVVESMAG